MLNCDMSRKKSRAEGSSSLTYDRHGFSARAGICCPDELYNEHLALLNWGRRSEPPLDMAVSMFPIPLQSLECEDANPQNKDVTVSPMCIMRPEFSLENFPDPDNRYNQFREVQEHVQQEDFSNISSSFPETFTDGTRFCVPQYPVQEGINNASGDSIASAAAQEQVDALGGLTLTPYSNNFLDQMFREPAAVHVHGHHPINLGSNSQLRDGIDPCIRSKHNSCSTLEASYPSPASQSARESILRTTVPPSPGELSCQDHALMQLQLNFALNDEFIRLQGAQGKSRSHDPILSLLPAVDTYFPERDGKSGLESSGEIMKFEANLDTDVDTSCGLKMPQLHVLHGKAPTNLPPLNGAHLAAPSPMRYPEGGSEAGLICAGGRQKKDILAAPVAEAPHFHKRASFSRVNSDPAPLAPQHGSASMDTSKARNAQNRDRVPSNKCVAQTPSHLDAGPVSSTFAREKLRREKLTENYNTLKSMLPKHTKVDRASILQATIARVKLLESEKSYLENMKQKRSIMKNLQAQEKAAEGQISEQSGEVDCHWLKRTSRHGTRVDMRIVHDEMYVNIVQQHLPMFLLRIMSFLETKLKLDILNATGSVINGFDVYNFELKIKGELCGDASEVMRNIMDTLDSVI
ncbi:protein MpBHLH8 [Marchantia polymorpha subsp. ruderalis]|uniref:BHLH domain-containing protein n=2 Tax=Marchantia polymorpha TaxID=3197 RepID=A0A176WCJ8_MARPO|nr:hypothetical protein AXG93_3522s1190 [Marchantia polymorpha subsp. ruderalis]PTQ44244.1 hypothetical protein MARPO_0021s0100 [Marchantia polymorpha]BBN01319.1 hypothetical protein Mp_2g06450 [Marchantia polymorpha subsp. ruderalis]|eukprot:PTQ44244.1 hypothetical protein MARPO_0021s0100 [Marchantia polymorpha]